MSEGGYWTQLTRRRVSRRRLLQASAVGGAALAGLPLIGCGGGGSADERGQGGTSSQPTRGGTLRLSVGSTSYTDVMDPHTSGFQAGFIYDLIGNTAFRLSPGGTELQPELVASYEIPGDGSEIILKVRQGVRWHQKPPTNGRALDAEDVAFNINRIAGKLNPNEVARFQRRTTLFGLDRAEVVDGSTVRVKLERPVSTFLNGLTDYRNQFVPKDFVENGGDFAKPESLVGSGPFVIQTFTNLERAVFARNADYWEQGKPYLDAVEWVWNADPVTAITLLGQGQIHLWVTEPTVQQRNTVRQLASSAREEKWAFQGQNLLKFNVQRQPFTDPRVRRALQLALDYKSLNDNVYGEGYWDYATMIASSYPEALPADQVSKLPGWNPGTKEQDIKTAKDLMAAAGYPDGKVAFKVMRYPIAGSVWSDLAISIMDQWERVWPAMQVEFDEPGDAAAFGRRQVQGDFDAYVYVEYGYPDPVLELTNQFGKGGGRNYSKFSDSRVEDLLAKAYAELDMEARAGIVRQIQQYLVEEQMPLVTIGQPMTAVWFHPSVGGMQGYGRRVGGAAYHDTYTWLKDGWLAS